MNPLKNLWLLALLVFALGGCIKDEIEADVSYGIEPEFGVPIAHASIEAEKIIDNFDENGIINSDDNGSLSLVYIDTLEGLTSTGLLDLPNQSFERGIDVSDLNQAEAIDFGTLTIVEEQLYAFESQEGDRLETVQFESGNFHLVLNSTGTYPVSGVVRMIDATNTAVFSTSFSDQVPPIQIESNTPMDETTFQLINNDEVTNGVRFEYELTFTDVPGATAGSVDFEIEMDQFSIQSMRGYIAPREIPFEGQNVGVHLFDQSTVGELRVEDPKLHLYFDNGFGLGLDLSIDELRGTNAEGEVMVIDGDNIDNFPLIDGAAFEGDVVNSQVTLSNETVHQPNVTDFMAFGPKEVDADLVLLVNPNDEENVFVSSDNELGLSFEAEIPIFGSIQDFLLVDTTDVSLGDFVESANETGEVEAMDLRLFVNNGFPIDAGVQIVFVDRNMEPIDSLFQTPDLIFASAPVNLTAAEDSPEYGRATGKTPTLTTVSLTQDRIPALEDVSNMIIRVFGNTTGNGDHPIRLTDSDNFDVHLSAKTKLNFDD